MGAVADDDPAELAVALARCRWIESRRRPQQQEATTGARVIRDVRHAANLLARRHSSLTLSLVCFATQQQPSPSAPARDPPGATRFAELADDVLAGTLAPEDPVELARQKRAGTETARRHR